MIQETQKVEVPVRKWWQRFAAGAPSVEKTIDTWTNEGWTFLGKTPVTDEHGKTTKYVLTFEKE
jgi:hypothetical protein